MKQIFKILGTTLLATFATIYIAQAALLTPGGGKPFLLQPNIITGNVTVNSIQIANATSGFLTADQSGNVTATTTINVNSINATTSLTQAGVPVATVPPQVVTGYAPPNVFWSDNVNVGTSTMAVTAIQIPYSVTLTGIGFAVWDNSTGSTTIGLYNNAGVLIASSTVLKISGTFATITQPFQSPIAVTPGIYYEAILGTSGATHFVGSVSFAKTEVVATATIPSSFATSSLSGNGIIPMIATY